MIYEPQPIPFTIIRRKFITISTFTLEESIIQPSRFYQTSKKPSIPLILHISPSQPLELSLVFAQPLKGGEGKQQPRQRLHRLLHDVAGHHRGGLSRSEAMEEASLHGGKTMENPWKVWTKMTKTRVFFMCLSLAVLLCILSFTMFLYYYNGYDKNELYFLPTNAMH